MRKRSRRNPILKTTRENSKDTAARQLAMEALVLKRRREILDDIESGKWRVEMPAIETLRAQRGLCA